VKMSEMPGHVPTPTAQHCQANAAALTLYAVARDDAAVGLDNAETEGGGRQDDTNSILSSKSACWIASYMQHLYPNYVCHFNNYNKTVYRFPFVCEFI
jgi:hypothetical protein